MTDFNEAVTIIGSSDEPQFVIQGHTLQTDPLQDWQTAGADVLARVTGDGRLQVGSFDSGVMATDESLIEAHRAETDTTKPKRGLHLMGAITGALNAAVSWVVQELTLKGTGGLEALHTGLRVRVRNESTGTPGYSGELRGADIEVTHAGSGGGFPILTAIGLRVGLNHEGTATITNAYGLKVDLTNSPDAYAIHTNAGKLHFGGLSAGVLSVDGSGDVTSGPAGATALDDLTDVDTTGAASGKILTYDGSLWVPQTLSVPSGIPTGSGMPYFGSSAPSGWLLCDGTAVSRTTYAALLAVVGDIYKRFTTLATRTSDTAGTVDLGYSSHGITTSNATITLRFTIAAATISAVNTTTDVITTSAAHLFDTGDKVQVSSTATLPTGLVAATNYYVRVVSSTTLSFHTTLADAQNNTNLVNLTGAGTGTRTITPQDEGVRSGMSVTNVAAGVLTLSGGSGHMLPAAAKAITVEGASGLFFLPDLRGRTAIGAGQGVGLTNRTPATLLGEEMHQLTIAEMPSHNHTSAQIVGAAGDDHAAFGGGNHGGDISIPAQGGNTPHNTMQPSLVTNYIIKA